MKKFSFIAIFLTLLFLGACKIDESIEEDKAPPGSAEYTLTFQPTWSKATHPTDFPSNPHFSPLVGAAHNDNVNFWNRDQKASYGIEVMAETGGTGQLVGEIYKAYLAKNSLRAKTGGGVGRSPDGKATVKFYATKAFPLLTMVSMLAPSPDWFTGIHDHCLLDKSSKDKCSGDWIKNQEIDVRIYDAGTDNGPKFTSDNDNTSPQGNITLLKEGAFAGNTKDGKPRHIVGTFTLKLEKVN